MDRALKTGFPVGIEQDLAWYVDPATGKGRVVVTHTPKTNGSEPTLRDYFFEKVRPIVEKALAENDRAHWPLIVLHFDFKDNQEPLLRAVWELLGQYQGWITTAVKSADPHELTPFDAKPLLVLTEIPDEQERVFYTDVPVGAKLRLFGSAHTAPVTAATRKEENHLLATCRRRNCWWTGPPPIAAGGTTRGSRWKRADSTKPARGLRPTKRA